MLSLRNRRIAGLMTALILYLPKAASEPQSQSFTANMPGAVVRPLVSKAGESLSVADFGSVPDGRTDNTAALTRAFLYAASHQGTRLSFPCSNGQNVYLVLHPLAIPPFTTLTGDSGMRCEILYSPSINPGKVNAAFAVSGEGFVTISNLHFQTSSGYPPASILELGRVSGNAGQNIIENCAFRGYVTKALVYSIASENNIWRGDYFEYQGGGAPYGYYTSGKDDFGICPSCAAASNLSLYFEDFIFVIDDASPFRAIGDQAGGGTGDHYYERGYIGLNKNLESVGIQLIAGTSTQGGPNSLISIKDVRIENGGYGLHFKKNDQSRIYNVDIEDLTWSSYAGKPSYFAYGETGVALDQFRMVHNNANQSGVVGPSSFDSLMNSTLDESYGQITVRTTARGNFIVTRGAGVVSMPSGEEPFNIYLTPGKGTTRQEKATSRLDPGFGGYLAPAPDLRVTSEYYILTGAPVAIRSIIPPAGLVKGSLLKLQNNTGGMLVFASGGPNSIEAGITVPNGRFILVLWDGSGWASQF